MKKTYINPNIKVVKIATQKILVTSDPYSKAKFDPTATSNTMDSRCGFDWEDDEE